MSATEMALNNPLIDEYSLQGAKGLLINITGGNDLKLFEVDQSVNKIRAEVDPEAEIIFGAIKDENMTGKIRVSIVATALDGYKTEDKTVLDMVSRIHNRNTGYSENLFPQNLEKIIRLIQLMELQHLELDESYQLDEEEYNRSNNNYENLSESESFVKKEDNSNLISNELPSGLSIESASYMEQNNLVEHESNPILYEDKEDYTPKLFSDARNYQTEEKSLEETHDQENKETDQLFDQEINEEDDFEIPAFLRKQKF